MIGCVTQQGIEVGSRDDLQAAAALFNRSHCLTLRGFLPPDLLADFQRRIAVAPFVSRVHDQVPTVPPPIDLVMTDDGVESRLLFLINDDRLFSLVERITGCDPIGSYIATVYRMSPGDGHHDAWHSDMDGNRLIALSINMSPAVYEGGVLQIKEWRTGRVCHEVANTGPGDALLFRLSTELEHRVTEVTGTAPKVAMAGWFQRTPVYRQKFPKRPIRANRQ